MIETTPITIAYGDGIGPEIMQAVLLILKNAEAKIIIETIEIGESLYNKNYISGLSEDSLRVIEKSNILLKAPITTPQGGGYKSINVTLRKMLGLYANVRPSISYYPFISSKYKNLNVVIIRENEEDLYTGIEYRHTHNVRESIKLITRTGCQKIVRYAFEYATAYKRKKVTCFSKDNIMKFTDGLFHEVFKQIAEEYPQINNEHYIVDIGTAKLATEPEYFDVIVTSNLFGDIISDVTAAISGSVGLAGSVNIGTKFAMFEAVHGSAPNIAGQNKANPSGLLNAAIMMLTHIGQGKAANIVENAWKKTIEDGIHTEDIYSPKHTTKIVGTKEFSKEVVARLGQKPTYLEIANNSVLNQVINNQEIYSIKLDAKKKLVGVDIFININVTHVEEIVSKIKNIPESILKLQTISSKGLKLWPNKQIINDIISDHWCCRFITNEQKSITYKDITNLLEKFIENKINFIKVENLFHFNNKPGYSLAQGE